MLFFYFFIFLLIFGNPLPTPWARFAPFWIDFGDIVGSTFPALSAARAELLQRLRKKLRRELADNLQRTSNKLMQRTFPKAKSQAAYSIHRRDTNRNKPAPIKEGAAVLALAHSDLLFWVRSGFSMNVPLM